MQVIKTPTNKISPADPTLAAVVFNSLDVSPRTKESYTAAIRPFLGWLSQRELSPAILLGYKSWLAARPDLKPSTKATYLTAAKIYCAALPRVYGQPDLDLIHHPLTGQKIKGFQPLQQHRFGLSEEDIEKLAVYCRGLPPGPMAIRLRAIIGLLCLAGLRGVEVCRLDVGDYDPAAGRLAIWGKGQQDKSPLPIRPALANLLDKYLDAWQLADGPLFSHARRPGCRLTTRGLRMIVDAAFRAAGIPPGVSTHGGRKWFTTRLLKETGDPIRTAQQTRHRSLNSLVSYNDHLLTADRLKECEVFADVAL